MIRHIALALLAVLAAAVPAEARQPGEAKDGRPNILVVMTDDQTLADTELMPNVQRLLADKGTTFADAVTSFPLCCPARATFITGQYAHNHGVIGNFWPYGWYGMKKRGNTLGTWLQDAGYKTALVGKWLNGYGAVDEHGEIPKGWDIWRGLLDVSAYDYFNFVMNKDGKLKRWGDGDFASKLVDFADIEVTEREEPGLADVFGRLQEVFGPGPYSYWGKERTKDYSPDVTGRMTADLISAERKSKKPFFIWWSVAAPHREDVSSELMGRPGPDPRPPARYEDDVADLELPRPPNFNEPDVSDKPSIINGGAPSMTEEQIAHLEDDYKGRVGSLLAVDEHVAELVKTLKRTKQLNNTLIVFVSDNGWLQGEHRVDGDKFVPYEEAIRVPFILRGPRIPAGQVVEGQVANVDFAPTLLDAADAKAGRKLDGVSLLPTARKPSRHPGRAVGLEAPWPLFGVGDFGPFHAWARPYTGVRTDRYTYAVYTETDEAELYDRDEDPYQLENVIDDPAYADVIAELEAKRLQLVDCKGKSCNVAQ